jgi:hypothetical protein
MNSDDEQDHHPEPITGRCEHCEWYAVTGSHSEMVEAYQDHLRERHPKAWLRT